MNLYKILLMGLLFSTNINAQYSSHRKVYIFGKEENKAIVEQQLQLLKKEMDAVKERAIEIFVVEKGSILYKNYFVKPGKFALILIGKDGTEKHRAHNLLQPADLFSIIDAMPMRQVEMEKQRQ